MSGNPKMMPGYAQKYSGRHRWEIVVVSDGITDRAMFKGTTVIDGTPHNVWTAKRHLYAQVRFD